MVTDTTRTDQGIQSRKSRTISALQTPEGFYNTNIEGEQKRGSDQQESGGEHVGGYIR